MRKIIAHEWMSLDGVVQAPSYASEDPAGGFAHGGWHIPYFDDLSQKWIVSSISAARAFLFGAPDLRDLRGALAARGRRERPLAEPLNTRPEVRRIRDAHRATGVDELDPAAQRRAWRTARAQARKGPDLHLIGSTQLARTLLAHDLIDEMRRMIDPLTLGAGKRFFPGSGTPRQLRLSDSQVTTTAPSPATYTARLRPASIRLRACDPRALKRLLLPRKAQITRYISRGSGRAPSLRPRNQNTHERAFCARAPAGADRLSTALAGSEAAGYSGPATGHPQ